MNRRRVRRPDEDEQRSMVAILLVGLSCLRAFWTLRAELTPVSRTREGLPDKGALYSAVSCFKERNPDLWGFAVDLDVQLPGVLTSVEKQIVELVHFGGPSTLLDIA
jgi:hypothetical protein